MSNYYEKRNAKVRIAHELMNRGWDVKDYKPDKSDSMTDYYSPANWGGIAIKNGYILCVDTPHAAKRVPITKYNYKSCLSIGDQNKIEKLSALTQERGATPGEEANAKALIEKIKNSKDTTPKKEITGYTIAHMANPGRCKWHIEKDGSIYDKGSAITKYSEIPESYVYDIGKMEFKDGYKTWRDGQKRKLSERQEKVINDFKKLILRWERVVNSMNGMGDGTKETEEAAQEQLKNEKMEKIIKKVTKKVKKMVEIKRSYFKIGDYITLPYHGHYWKITSENMYKGKWKGIEESRKVFVYELIGAASRGYQDLKSPKSYYQYEYQMLSELEKGNIKIYELKEVEETKEIENWVRVKNPKVKDIKKKETQSTTNTQNTSVEADLDTLTVTGIQVQYNQEKGGIELIFPGKPETEVLSQLKANGFRWSRYQKLWWAKDTAERRAFIKDVLQTKNNNINNSIITEDTDQTMQQKKVAYPEVNINDIDSYTVPEELSKRENNNAMFRSEDIDHTKELQKTLQSANNDVIELCKMPSCTEYIQYKAKSYLQSFKGKYTDAYISILEHKVNNPSWVVTGRGNLNTSKYNKKQEQYDRKLQYANRLIDKFNSKIQQYRNQINSINNKKEYNQYLQDIKGIDPSKEKFKKTRVKINRGAVDHIFNNADYEVAAYEYKGYYILKNYSRFNIYDSKGQEIEQKYTDGTLRNAKINLIYYLSNLTVTEQVI
ncbi:hypothetical protein ACFHWD_03770 [Clostridium sp. MT-14]|uniref:hypothetical protein n=1 Tax=Clostridium sp. MT-14 TaxID=3348360 RepID=UPI0035F4E16C